MSSLLAAAWRYRREPSLACYTACKSLMDPAYAFVAGTFSGSKLPLLDIGCGAGHLAAYLRARGFTAPITGVDADARKIAAARNALPDCEFLAGDALNLPEHSGNVVLLDVLHYFSVEDRRRLLMGIRQRLASEGRGRAVLRVTLRDSSWRFAVTRLEEWIVRVSGWIPFRASGFPTREELLAHCGDSLQELRPLWSGTPFNSYVLILQERPPDGRA